MRPAWGREDVSRQTGAILSPATGDLADDLGDVVRDEHDRHTIGRDLAHHGEERGPRNDVATGGRLIERAVRIPSVARSRRVIESKTTFEPNLPTDLMAQGPAALVGDALRDRTRGHTTRLQQDDRPLGEQGRRNTRRLSSARLGGDDDRTGRLHGIDDRGDV